MVVPADDLPVRFAASRWRVTRSLVLPLVIAALAVGWPALLDRGHVVDDIVHGTAVWIIVGAVAVIAAGLIFLWRPASLELTVDGITYAVRGRTYFYGWRDLAGVELARTGPRLIVHGLSDLRNGYNILPAGRFGVSRERLADLIRAGMARFAATPASRPSVTQGADAAVIEAASTRAVIAVVGGMAGIAVALLLAAQGSTYRRTMALRDHGERAVGHVVRFYTGSCGHGRCSTNVEYTYLAAVGERRRTFRGHAYLTQNGRDANLLLARQTGIVPIVYDTATPARSTVNYADWVFRSNPASVARFMIGVFGAIIVVVFGGLTAVTALGSRARRRKLANDG